MKTAVSVPDDVFREAEYIAAKSGMSRSELYVTALRAYLNSTREDRITEQLDAVYGVEHLTLDPFMLRAAKSVGRRSETS